MLFVSSGRLTAAAVQDEVARFEVAVDRESGWGHVVVAGDLSLERLLEYLVSAWENGAYQATRKAIWDLRDATIHIPTEALGTISDFARERRAGRGPGRVAVVIDPLRERRAVPACRLFEEGAGVRPVLFTDYYEAVDWLGDEALAD